MEGRGLDINRKKTEYLNSNEDKNCEIIIQDKQLKNVDKFKYSVVTGDGNMNEKTEKRYRMQGAE